MDETCRFEVRSEPQYCFAERLVLPYMGGDMLTATTVDECLPLNTTAGPEVAGVWHLHCRFLENAHSLCLVIAGEEHGARKDASTSADGAAVADGGLLMNITNLFNAGMGCGFR